MLNLSRISCIGEALRDALITYPSHVALIEADRHRERARYDYHGLRREAERVSALLTDLGLGEADGCAILMSNQSKWVIGAIGAIWSGAVLVPLDYKLTPQEQLTLLAHARPKVLITEYVVLLSLCEASDAADVLRTTTLIVTDAPDAPSLTFDTDGVSLTASRFDQAARAPFRFVPRRRADVACVVYSSGTGGAPKGCVLTHDNYLEQATALAGVADIGEHDRYFSIVPTNHALDFMCGVIMPFMFGAAVVHQRTLRAEFMLPTMQRYGVTHTALVPRILRALRSRIEEQLDDLPRAARLAIDSLANINELATARRPSHGLSRLLLKPIHDRFGGRLRRIFAGGAFVDPDLAEFFYRLGLPIVIGYGLTEACAVLTVNDLKPFRATTVGRPVPGVEIDVRNPGPDGIGEVYARGRTIMMGYLDDADATSAAFDDGWLRTGDLGTIDASGHLRLFGRSKNMIVTDGGKNVYPEDIESAFESIDCEELCVYARSFLFQQRGLGKEQLVLVVRPRKNAALATLRAEIAAANLRLADYKRVASYLVVSEDFPRTASMKIKRGELALAIQRAGRAPELLKAS